MTKELPYHNAPETLRKIAREVEAETNGKIVTAALVTVNAEGKVEVYGMGPESGFIATVNALGVGMQHAYKTAEYP